MIVGLFEALWDDPDVALRDRRQSALREGPHLDEPLVADERLDHLAAPLAARDAQRVGLLLDHQPLRLQHSER